jgi:Glycosyl transferase family 2
MRPKRSDSNPGLMAKEAASITVIIPTTLTANRRASLLNAIHSAGEQSGAATKTLVVVNGQRFDPTLLDLLRLRQDINVVLLQVADLPGALFVGRQLVETEFFCFLDDDDEILPNGLAARLRALTERPEVAFVVTNGYYRSKGEDQVRMSDADMVSADPLLAMTDKCWLASCGGLYRTSLVDVRSFADVPRFLEWTYLGLKLASTRKMLFLDEPTFRIHDSEDSLSKSVDYRAGSVAALKAALQLPLPQPVTHRLRMRLSAAHHLLAGDYLSVNELRLAWAHHLASLAQPGGAKYLLFSRRLIPFWPRSSSVNGLE